MESHLQLIVCEAKYLTVSGREHTLINVLLVTNAKQSFTSLCEIERFLIKSLRINLDFLQPLNT